MGCEAMAMQHRETGLPFVAAKASLNARTKAQSNAGIVDVYSAKRACLPSGMVILTSNFQELLENEELLVS